MNRTLLLALGAVALLAPVCRAQVPFFGNSGNSFDPQIDVVNSGVLLDAQAVVSNDRKYVTLTMRPQQAALIALRDFSFQNGVNGQNQGFVGMPQNGNAALNNAANATNNGAARNARKAAAAPPAPRQAQPARNSVLERDGMTRVDQRGR